MKKIIKNYNLNDKFFVNIKSSHKKNGSLHYGELILQGKSNIELIISTVNQFDEWNLELERKLTSFFSVDLVDKEETYFYLASRRLMRHYFFHLVHQLYLHRYSESTFSIAKSEFVKRAQLIRSLLICILSELKGNISSLSSDSDPLTVLSTNIANSLG